MPRSRSQRGRFHLTSSVRNGSQVEPSPLAALAVHWPSPKALFSSDAPKSKVYNKLDYKAVARDPDAHKGDLITFSGKVLQVMESGNYVVFRISSKGNYDNVVYCTYTAPDNYKRVLEDDKVNVYGTCTGIYTYETIMGGSVTIPSCRIDRIEVK